MRQKSFFRFLGFQSDNRKSKTCPELCRRIEKRPRGRKWVGLVAIALTGAFTLFGVVVEAQQPGKIFRIGFLDSSTVSGSAVLLGGVPARAEQAWVD